MAELSPMPAISLDGALLRTWGGLWLGERNPENGKSKQSQCFDKQQSMRFGRAVFDHAIARSLSAMVGNVPVTAPTNNRTLLPPSADCIEIGDVRVIGGVRPQNFDVVYRPDGVRIAFDSKTLNDLESVRKNWQNMVNDLATEATTVHIRFPYAIVAFLVAVPRSALASAQELDIIRTLERLGTRRNVQNQEHLAEVISLVVWNPETGTVDDNVPAATSHLRLEEFSEILYKHYLERYKGLPPHDRE